MERERIYGIDLLKIVAMFFVVVNHALWWGGYGLGTVHGDVKGIGLELLDSICICAVNCFVLASGWVMWRLDFKFMRIVKLWGQVVFYSVLLAGVARLWCPSLSLTPKQMIQTFLPIRTNAYWFFTQYVGLFFLMPVLNHLVRTMSPRQLKFLVVGGGALFSLLPFVLRADPLHVCGGYGVLWFSYLYVVAGVWSRDLTSSQHWFSNIGIEKLLVAFFGCAFLGLCGTYVSSFAGQTFHYGNGICYFYSNYNSPIMLVQSVALLLVFAKINPMSNHVRRLIAFAAPSVFSVYLIHSNGMFRRLTDWNAEWSSCFGCHSLVVSVALVISVSLGIFCGSVVVDYGRRRIVSAIQFLGKGVCR